MYSNYIWRGTTFSENKPAVQADLDYEDKNGYFVGTFLSNAEFSDQALGNNAHVTTEVDFLAGKVWVGERWEIQATYNRYTFPGAGVFDADDFSLTGNYESWYIELSYMDDYFGYKSIYKYFRVGYGWTYSNGAESIFYAGYNAFTTPKGQIKTRCLSSDCSEAVQTTTGAGNPDYIDLYLLNRKILENGMVLELGINWTNRQEYTVNDSKISLDSAKDFTTVVAIIMPVTL